ncbi:MAG: hypothetical protein LBM61_00345, partial [Prevotellaceae bacterium]|nr:hypothetical protein [Prevotellaceae bacterium]
MRKIFLMLLLFLIGSLSYAQEVTFIKEKEYSGYIFPRGISIWGFPAEGNRYTPSIEDVFAAERILKDSISSIYVKSHQEQYVSYPINKRSLKKYIRQYVGYLNRHNEPILWI